MRATRARNFLVWGSAYALTPQVTQNKENHRAHNFYHSSEFLWDFSILHASTVMKLAVCLFVCLFVYLFVTIPLFNQFDDQ